MQVPKTYTEVVLLKTALLPKIVFYKNILVVRLFYCKDLT